MKSTEILTTIMYSSTYKSKGNILAKFPIHVHADCTFCRGISNIIVSLQQNDTHVVEVQRDINRF